MPIFYLLNFTIYMYSFIKYHNVKFVSFILISMIHLNAYNILLFVAVFVVFFCKSKNT